MQPLAAVVIAVVAASGLLVAVARPNRTILPAYAALVPIGSVFKLGVPLPEPFNTLSSLFGGIAIAAMLLHVVLTRRARIPSLPVGAWLVFLAWSASTALWARRPGDVVRELSIALPLLLLVVIVGILPRERGDLDRLRIAIVLGGAVVGAYALFLVATGSSLPTHGFGERFSVASDPGQTNPNQLAATLLLPFVLSLDLVITGCRTLRHRAFWRFLGCITAFMILVPIVLSGSRGGLLAAVIAVLLTLAFTWWWIVDARRSVVRTATWMLLSIVVLATASYLAVRLAPEGKVAEVLSSDPIQRVVAGDSGTSGRAEIWTTGLLACERYCGMGAGLGNFPTVYGELFAFSGAERNVGLERPGHNLYLEVVVETGVVGLTLLAVALIAEWMAMRTTGRAAPALAAVLVALLVVDMFEGFIWFKYFWLPFILIRIAEEAGPGRSATLRETMAHAA